MASTRGRLLVATPLLGDPNFERTVILVIEHTEEGALGVVLNRPSPLRVEQALDDWAEHAAAPAVVFIGGPVATGSVIALARRRGDLPEEAWSEVLPRIGVLDIGHDAALLATALDGVRIFTGYAGWGASQLEGEIDEGAWWAVEALAGDALTTAPEALWRTVLERQPQPLRQWARYPPDPAAN
jgi:putative transcriptional regulator